MSETYFPPIRSRTVLLTLTSDN